MRRGAKIGGVGFLSKNKNPACRYNIAAMLEVHLCAALLDKHIDQRVRGNADLLTVRLWKSADCATGKGAGEEGSLVCWSVF